MRRYAILTAVLLAATATAFGQAKQMKVKSKKEGEAVQALLSAPDSAARIKAADELITKFADTDFKAYALFLEAQAYADSGNNEKAIVYGEQALEADPKNYQAGVLMARTYAITTKSTDLDKAEKIAKTTKYANDAIEQLKTAEKPNPQLTDAQWTETKNDLAGQCYFALGVAAAYSNKMDEVAADFQKTAEMDSDPTDLIRAGRVLLDVKKYEQAATWFDKAATSPNANAQVKDIAGKDKARALAMVPKK